MTDRQPERIDGTLLEHREHPPRFAQGDSGRWAVQCLNCDSPLHGPFCSRCGQRAIPPHPTLRQLAGDAVDEFSGWDGKFIQTLKTLFRKPGELTRQWLEGRRIQFISPWRLYLTTSLVYFAVTTAAPNLRNTGGVDLGIVSFGATSPGSSARTDRVSSQATEAIRTNQPLTGAERDSALADIAEAPPILQPLLRRAVDEPAAFKNAIQRAIPNVFLGLIPVLAGILALFFRRRHYPEHLYFAVHFAAFVFLTRAAGNLALFTRNIPIAAAVQFAVLGWIAVYGVIAIRRVYGGSIRMTIVKGAAIALLYAIVALPVILAVAFIAAST